VHSNPISVLVWTFMPARPPGAAKLIVPASLLERRDRA
jgi:hypothetical protein